MLSVVPSPDNRSAGLRSFARGMLEDGPLSGYAYVPRTRRMLVPDQLKSLSTFTRRHKLSYYEGMSMTSLNISLPEALKEYVEGQVATGDWGTPSEYIRELIRQDKERRLANLEQELVAAVKGTKIEIPLAEIRRKGLIAALRERARRP
jgi:antitoxin ParD1/3/4